MSKKQGPLVINGQTIEAGENKTIILNSYELHTKTRLEIPVHVIRAKEPGPSILLSAGMHGEETNGIEIIRKVISREEVDAWRSLRNATDMHLIVPDQLNAYDVLVSDDIVFTETAIREFITKPATAVARESEVEVSA